MKKKSKSPQIGPFALSQENAIRFGNNMFSSYLLSTTIIRMNESKEKHSAALVAEDQHEIETRAIELEAYECSLAISYNLFEDDGYVS